METNREKFLKKHMLPMSTSLSLREMARISGMPLAALQLVYNRGIGAARTNPESVRVKGTFVKDPSVPRRFKLSDEQWAFARVYAFMMKTQKVYYGADDDIRRKYSLR